MKTRARFAAVLFATACAAIVCGVAVGQSEQVTTPQGQVSVSAVDDSSATHITVQALRRSVDVVVTDYNGKPVPGLSRSDFTVYEDGVVQALRSFEPHTPATEVAYEPPKLPKLPPNTFVNLATAPETGTPTVLLYDVLNTPLEAQGYAHEEMVSFIKHRKPGTQVAIFVLSDKLHLLQGFTDDSEMLTRALDRKNGSVTPSTQLSSAGSSGTTSEDLAPAQLSNEDPRQFQNPNVSATVGTMASFEALEQSYLLDQRIGITLDGLTEIGRFLAGLPGRKNVVWLSASFPSGILPNSSFTVTSLAQDQSTRNYSEEIKEATDLLNVAHVAVYPVDVRGMVVPTMYSAANAVGDGPGTYGSGRSVSKFVVLQAADHSTMDSIAESTGGRAYYSTNDIQGAVKSAMENGSTYYAITYLPTNTKLDGGLRKIQVKLDKPGLKLAYRTSYYADDLQRAEQAAADAPQNVLSPSLERGAPVAHELFIEARMQAVGEPVAATPKQLEMLAEYEAMTSKKKGKKAAVVVPANTMMQSYLITYGLVPRQLDLRAEPSGVHKASLELGVLSYDRDGRKLNGVDSHLEDNIPASRYAKIPEEGYHLYQTVIIPVTAATVRLAVRDNLANRVGSLEVPLPLEKIQ